MVVVVLKKIESGVKRVVAAVVGLLLGIVLGFLASGLLFESFQSLGPSLIGGAVTGLVTALIWPAPFLFVGELLLSVVGIELA